MRSMQKDDGIVRVVFATIALGMGVNFKGLNAIIHYGAPRSIDDFLQESGRAGRSGTQATSIVYWKPVDARVRKVFANQRDKEVAAVRKYLENNSVCRRFQLLNYFNPEFAKSLPRRNPSLCCDVCANSLLSQLYLGWWQLYCTKNTKHFPLSPSQFLVLILVLILALTLVLNLVLILFLMQFLLCFGVCLYFLKALSF